MGSFIANLHVRTEDTAALDWKDVLKGIEYDMAPEAIRDAVQNWYRDVDYRTLLSGGLQALRTFATTPGIEVTGSRRSRPSRTNTG